jgi:hypothetical protein
LTGGCNTHAFVQAVNAQGLCGASDWRMPTRSELMSIVDNGRSNPAIDSEYFPNTPSWWYWSSSPYANGSSAAWNVGFYNGRVNWHGEGSSYHVRLVRAGQ